MSWLIYGAVGYLVYKMVMAGDKPAKGDAKATGKPKKVRSGPPPHEVLGVEPSATREEIKRAYQRMVGQYHPDRVANAAPELQKLAEKRTKQLNAAYAELMSDDSA
jgi:DnaJ-class molecular chaperone